MSSGEFGVVVSHLGNPSVGISLLSGFSFDFNLSCGIECNKIFHIIFEIRFLFYFFKLNMVPTYRTQNWHTKNKNKFSVSGWINDTYRCGFGYGSVKMLSDPNGS